jgi:hypothetical protein
MPQSKKTTIHFKQADAAYSCPSRGYLPCTLALRGFKNRVLRGIYRLTDNKTRRRKTDTGVLHNL